MRMAGVLLIMTGMVCAQSGPLTSVSEKTAGMDAIPGFFPLYHEPKAGKLWLEIARWNTEFLYVPSLPAGIGSNDIGLDRGQLGQERVVRFERHGPKVLLVQPNLQYVAGSSSSADERRSVEEAFAQSVLWGFEAAAEDGERVLVDATSFFLRDAHGVMERLRSVNQGTFKLEPSRSALYAPRIRNFPRNTEVEAILTFVSENPGPWIRSVTPSPDSVTVRQHHSLIQLPDDGYQPRAFDPRSGFFPGAEFADYSVPLGEPITKRFIARHRLTKDKPIVYYLDPGTPEPVRSALLDGARWWAEAFAAAGFPNGYRVEMLPSDADPMDVRYNVIQWVHRSTRGWSYGTSITDPRTGEILKGHVTLGSLRVRQDYLIAEALLAPYEAGGSVSPAMEEMALARLRQLSAHEVGHTLGLAHNFAASTSDRASVMDYPHPLATMASGGVPDLSKAYAFGLGEWDKAAIVWGYSESPGDVLDKARGRGLRFITDADARPPGGAHPQAHLWDNGVDAAAELDRVMQVRRRALERFGENNIRSGFPLSSLEDVLVPLYMGHRYQVEAAAKLLGGLDYNYALRGDGQRVTQLVPGAEQKRALTSLLATIQPDALTLPERILAALPPRAFQYERTRESFRGRTGVTFDPLAAAEAAANHTLGLMLHPERAARLVQYHARDSSIPSLDSVLEAVLAATWRASAGSGVAREVQRVVNTVALYHLMSLAAAESAPVQVRAITHRKLSALKETLARTEVKDALSDAESRFALKLIERFERDPGHNPLPRPLDPPPGQPI